MDKQKKYIFVKKKNAISCKAAQASAMVLFGGLSGGVSSHLAGGSFRQGFSQGIITAGLNHALHMGADAMIHFKITARDERNFKYLGHIEFDVKYTQNNNGTYTFKGVLYPPNGAGTGGFSIEPFEGNSFEAIEHAIENKGDVDDYNLALKISTSGYADGVDGSSIGGIGVKYSETTRGVSGTYGTIKVNYSFNLQGLSLNFQTGSSVLPPDMIHMNSFITVPGTSIIIQQATTITWPNGHSQLFNGIWPR